MFEANVRLVLTRLRDTDIVLDIGGWACPFNRAQWVMDAEPYDTRGFYRTFGGPPSQGGEDEWFSKETWVQRDLCDKTPYPFPDKFFDFVICSHTLEDLRDPIWVCKEMARIGKRGYLEVPSRAWESSWGVERWHQAGLSHHRWLVEIHGQRITFMQKYALMHSHWRYSLAPSFTKRCAARDTVQWLWWEGGFDVEEHAIHGAAALESALRDYVAATHPHAAWRTLMDDLWRGLRRQYKAIARWLIHTVGRAVGSGHRG